MLIVPPRGSWGCLHGRVLSRNDASSLLFSPGVNVTVRDDGSQYPSCSSYENTALIVRPSKSGETARRTVQCSASRASKLGGISFCHLSVSMAGCTLCPLPLPPHQRSPLNTSIPGRQRRSLSLLSGRERIHRKQIALYQAF